MRRPATDERQTNIFDASPPVPSAAEPSSFSRRRKRERDRSRAARAPDGHETPAQAGIDALAACVSPAELDDLVAALPDDALAHLVLAAVRQLRRRLTRAGGRSSGGGKGRGPVLERTARQLAAELGGSDDA